MSFIMLQSAQPCFLLLQGGRIGAGGGEMPIKQRSNKKESPNSNTNADFETLNTTRSIEYQVFHPQLNVIS